jgi:hypothetical protein
MATIVNTPGETREVDNSGTGVVIGVLAVILLVLLALLFGLPYLRNRGVPADNGTNINVQLPGTGNTGGASGGASTGGTGQTTTP